MKIVGFTCKGDICGFLGVKYVLILVPSRLCTSSLAQGQHILLTLRAADTPNDRFLWQPILYPQQFHLTASKFEKGGLDYYIVLLEESTSYKKAIKLDCQ